MVKIKTKVVNFSPCKNLDEQVFRDHLASAPWHVAEVFDDVDDQSEFFSPLLKDVVDEHMPWKSMRVRDGDVPYMKTEWKEAILGFHPRDSFLDNGYYPPCWCPSGVTKLIAEEEIV